jgi:energy-coupling factor transporter transmembrane protein EcfT
MTEPVGPAHAASRLLVLVLWALAAFTAPLLGLVVLAGVSALAAAWLPSRARRRWAGGVVKFGPWALVWTVSAWWAAGFTIGKLAGAVRIGGATWVAVAGAELLLPGLMPSQVYQTVYDALAWANRRVAEDVAVVAAMMVRFIPLLRAEWQALMWALEVERPGSTPAARVRRAVAALVPLLARALARADTLALVLWLKRPHAPPPRRRISPPDVMWVVGVAAVWLVSGRMGTWPWR